MLCNLESDLPRSQDALGELPEMGIYVFYENGKPIYVGRTKRMKKRISEHGSPSPTKSATFAYLLAKKELEARYYPRAKIWQTFFANNHSRC